MKHDKQNICLQCEAVLPEEELQCPHCETEHRTNAKSIKEITQTGEYVCRICHYLGWPQKKKQGSRAVELTAWILFFPLGFLYTLWRLGSKKEVCPNCDSESMLSIYSLRGYTLRGYILRGYTIQGEKITPKITKKAENNDSAPLVNTAPDNQTLKKTQEQGKSRLTRSRGYRHKDHHGVLLEFDHEVGAYIVVELPGTYYYNGVYVRHSTNGYWEVAILLDGLWRKALDSEIPPKLLKDSYGD